MTPGMSNSRADPRTHCAGCGDTIGVYEPCWVERLDGTLHPSSLLNIDERDHARAARWFHVGCVIDDFPPEWSPRTV